MVNVSKNKILVIIGVLAVILVLAFASFAFAKVDVGLTVNSAFCVSQIIDKEPANGKFLVTNVTVKNNGKDPITISTDQFTPMVNGKAVEKYSVFSGAGTDLQNQVQIPAGASRDMVVVFDIGNQTPDALEFAGPIFWAPTYKNSTKISDVASTALFDGLHDTNNIGMEMNTTMYGINITGATNIKGTDSVQKTDDPDKMKFTTVENTSTITNAMGQQNSQNSVDNTTSTVDLKTGIDNNGTLEILPANMTKPGDSITTLNGVYTLTGSEKIDIMSKKVDCWVVNVQYKGDSSSGFNVNGTIYFDKTTRLPLKFVIKPQSVTVPGSSMPLTMQGQAEIVTTNLPIIGVA